MPTADLATLRALLSRVQAAAEADRVLDLEILKVFTADLPNEAFHRFLAFANPTGSIDSAVGLVGLLLPGYRRLNAAPGYIDGVYQDGKPVITLYSPLSSGGHPYWRGVAPTEPLSILAALLSALIAIAEREATDAA